MPGYRGPGQQHAVPFYYQPDYRPYGGSMDAEYLVNVDFPMNGMQYADVVKVAARKKAEPSNRVFF